MFILQVIIWSIVIKVMFYVTFHWVVTDRILIIGHRGYACDLERMGPITPRFLLLWSLVKDPPPFIRGYYVALNALKSVQS